MIRTIRLALGVAATLAGMLLGVAVLAPNDAAAGITPVCYTPTPPGFGPAQAPTDTPTPTDTPIPVCTSTPVIVRTATPTLTATSEATHTPVPPTEVATGTPVPPTATSPSGAPGGAGVQPPSTGSGPSGAGTSTPAVIAAAMLVLAGTSTLALAARKRR